MSDRVHIANGRELVALVAASGLVFSAWALFPSTVESGIYLPPTEAATASAKMNAANDDVVDGPRTTYMALHAKFLLSSSPSMMKGSVTLRNSSAMVDVSMVPLRSKLEALLLLLYQSDDVDGLALEAKIQALLKLPDFVLTQLMQHPDLAELTKMLDAVFLGTSEVSVVETELNKIEVTSVPGTNEQVHLIKVSGKPAYTVRTPAADEGIQDSAASPLSQQRAGEPVTLASEFDEMAGMAVIDFAVAPSSEPLPPPPEQARVFAPALVYAPSSEELPPPPPPPPPPPTSEAPEPLSEPTGTPQTSQDVIESGNKFEPGETVAQPGVDNSPATNSAPTQTSSSTPTIDPVEVGGGTGAVGETAPSDGN
jgi:hypothetical protein